MPGYVKASDGSWHKLYDAQVQVGNSWHRADRLYVKAEDETWRPFFQFVASVNTMVDVISTTGLSITNAPNEAYTVTGVMRNSATGTALPGGLAVRLASGTTQVATTTTASDGSFTLSWKPPKAGGYNPRVVFVPQGVYQPSEYAEGRLQASSPLTITTNWPSQIILGKPVTFTGTVKSATGETPSGTATLFIVNAAGTTANSRAAGVPINSSGGFSVTWTPSESSHGSINYYVKVDQTDTDRFPTTWSPWEVVPGYQPTPSAITQTVTSITNTSVKIKVDDQAYINYFIVRCAETGNTVRLNSTGTAGADLVATWDLGQDRTYHFTTTGYSDNPTDSDRVSSNTITVVTGHAATTDRGSGVFIFRPVKTGSWRSVDAWSYLGTKLGQGYYSTGSPYFGVATFNTQAMAATIDNYGNDCSGRSLHLSVSKTEIYLDRVSGAGSGADVPVNMYLTSSSVGTAGQPVLQGSMQQLTPGLRTGEHAWLTAPTAANTWLGSMISRDYGMCMYANNYSQYSLYNGGDSFALRVTCSWNWTPVPYKAPTYSG